ncbi:MAG: hypothetical protein QGI06_08130 [Rhodospirillales bacterium]|nr:hypothetical protein [Rhodospirillales bacterium]
MPRILSPRRRGHPPTGDAPNRRFPPLIIALLAQLLAAALVFGAAALLAAAAGVRFPLLAMLAAQGAVAALLGARFGLANWWIPLHIALPPAAAAATTLPVPAWVYLAFFLVLLLVFWNSARERVPLYLSNRLTWSALARLLPDRSGIAFLDVGSGLGGTLAHLARQRPRGRFAGIESAPLLFALSWLRLRILGPANVRLAYGDFWKQDLSPYDVVYCFLSPEPMPALYRKACAEMRPGSLFISNSFEVPGAPADEIVEVPDRRRTRLFVWRLH